MTTKRKTTKRGPERDLFGKVTPKRARRSRHEAFLDRYDTKTRHERAIRLRHVEQVYPPGDSFMPSQTFYVFSEIQMTFVNGEFVATILLATAFVEHLLSDLARVHGFARAAKSGLAAVEDCLRENKLLHPFLIDKVSRLRAIRNPFVHLKESMHPHSVFSRVMEERRAPEEILEEDARTAMELAYTIAAGKPATGLLL